MKLAIVGMMLTNLFSDHPAFSSVAQAQFQFPGQAMSMQAGICRLDEKFRIYVDTANTGGVSTPAANNLLKAFGIDRMVTILCLDKGIAWQLFPGLQGYVEVKLDWAAAKSETNTLRTVRIDKAPVGEDSIDGRVCSKSQLMGSVKGSEFRPVGFIWQGKAMKGFPLQLELNTAGLGLNLKLKDVKTVRLDAKLFEVPPGYKRLDN